MKKDELDQLRIEQTLSRLIRAGVGSLDELLEFCDESHSIDRKYLQDAINDNPFIGRNPNFQDLIENAVFGSTVNKGVK